MTLLLGKIKWVILAGGDITVLYLALITTLLVRYGYPIESELWQRHALPFSLLYLGWLLVFYIFGLYNLTLAKNNQPFYLALVKALGVCFLGSLMFFYFIPFFGIAPKTNLILNTFLVLLFFSLWRQAYNFFLKYPIRIQNILIIGKCSQALELKEYMEKNPQLGYQVSAIIEPAQIHKESSLFQPGQLILSAVDLRSEEELTNILLLRFPEFSFGAFASFYEQWTGKVSLSHIDKIWLLLNLKEKDKQIYEVLKGISDLSLAFILGIATLILLPFVALAIKLDSPGSLLYSQQRVGKNGRVFRLLKFRSMVSHAEKNGAVWAQKHDPRVTRVGNILRKTFIDELPQCINILKGEMSFIGPRPERPEFVEALIQEIPFYHIRHIVKPGITGWAQINFPYGNSTQGALEKLQYDLYYIKNRSFVLDLKILLKTINVISKGGTE